MEQAFELSGVESRGKTGDERFEGSVWSNLRREKGAKEGVNIILKLMPVSRRTEE